MIACHFQHTQRFPLPFDGFIPVFDSVIRRIFYCKFFDSGAFFSVVFQNTDSAEGNDAAEVGGIFFRHDLILIDEATEGLAPLVAKDIWKTLGVIRSEGVATVVVDKDFRSLSRIADRMVMLSKGTVVFDGTPAALAEKQDLLEQHLGV